MTKTRWERLIERVKRGETTDADARVLALVRQTLEALAVAYPNGGEYYAPLARVLRLHNRMEKGESDAHT